MKIMLAPVVVKVDTSWTNYEEEDFTYQYAIDTEIPMNDELYAEWKSDVVKMVTEDVTRRFPLERIERIYMEYTLEGKTYEAEL